MQIDVLTTFPDAFDSYMNSSIMRIAQDKNLLKFNTYNLRDWTHDKHMTTDDKPYGGGPGQLMLCEPIFEAFESLQKTFKDKPHVVFVNPNGKIFNDSYAQKLSLKKSLFFICGHYEGIDERAYTLADDIFSIGDYVITSGELASMVVIDSVVRKIKGVLGADEGAENESFVDGLLEYPQYTRPSNFRGMQVPEILLSGNHKKIEEWKRKQSIQRTFELRPDLLINAKLSTEEQQLVENLKKN